jgi:hypothetical protein
LLPGVCSKHGWLLPRVGACGSNLPCMLPKLAISGGNMGGSRRFWKQNVLGFQSQQIGHHLCSDSAQFAHPASDVERESAQRAAQAAESHLEKWANRAERFPGGDDGETANRCLSPQISPQTVGSDGEHGGFHNPADAMYCVPTIPSLNPSPLRKEGL